MFYVRVMVVRAAQLPDLPPGIQHYVKEYFVPQRMWGTDVFVARCGYGDTYTDGQKQRAVAQERFPAPQVRNERERSFFEGIENWRGPGNVCDPWSWLEAHTSVAAVLDAGEHRCEATFDMD